MTDSEKLDLILSRLEKLDKLEKDVTDIKLTLDEIRNILETEVRRIKAQLEIA